ncbi:MAG: hypothetical protein LC803_01985 [Acidobacteria bacterium]|nr:hypothetical protein [Acidobacteriota bacterium]
MTMIRRSTFALILLMSVSASNSGTLAQNNNVSLPEVNQSSTLSETLDWLNRTSFTHASIGIANNTDENPFEKKTDVSFYKGFKLVQAGGCALLLRNEGTYQNQARTPFLVEVIISLADLDSNSGKISQQRTNRPDMDKLYGTWQAKFKTLKDKTSVRINFKAPNDEEVLGSILTFTFEDKEVSKKFAKAFRHAITLCRGK